MISSKVHGYLDYLLGFLLIFFPFILNLINPIISYIAISLGISLILYSMLTDYECGLVKLITYRFHLFIDVFSGVVIAAMPWIWEFYNELYLPFLILGFSQIIISCISTRNIESSKEP